VIYATPIMDRAESARIYAALRETTPTPERDAFLRECDALFARVVARTFSSPT
jgi:hypothetical protein